MTDTDLTPLDHAHAAMADGDPAAELRFYDRLAAAELYLLLEAEPEGDAISPQVFALETGPVVVAFDREHRLAAFAEAVVPFAALPGRMLVEMLAGQGMGLGVNLDVAPSSVLLSAEAIDWMAERLAGDPQETEARPQELHAPGGLPEALLPALDAALASTGGLAGLAYLAGVTWESGARGHLLALIDPVPGAEPALARAVQQALRFSGLEAGVLDVAFFRASEPVSAQLARVALRIDLPEPPKPQTVNPGAAPGMDPDAPPKLR